MELFLGYLNGFEMEKFRIFFSFEDSSPATKRGSEGIITDSSVLSKHRMRLIISLINPQRRKSNSAEPKIPLKRGFLSRYQTCHKVAMRSCAKEDPIQVFLPCSKSFVYQLFLIQDSPLFLPKAEKGKEGTKRESKGKKKTQRTNSTLSMTTATLEATGNTGCK